jgi:hypothetical protein
MKQITSKLTLLAILGIISIAALSIESCSKSSSSPSGPAVTSVTSGAADTVGTTSTLTIVGTNLTGATVTTTATGVTISGITVTGSTSITGTITIGSTATPGTATLTITTSAGNTTTTITIIPIPLIGGYASSDSVAASNLIAYWPFDGDANDHKGGLTATATGITYSSTGVRGQAYQGAAGAYATYTLPQGGGPFASLGSYTVSFWYNLPAEQTFPQGIFFLSGTSTQDELINEIEPYMPVSGDSVRIHPGFNDLASPAYQLFVPETFNTNALGTWVHFVVTYNGGTSTYICYENAVPTGASTAFSPAPPANPYVTPTQMWTDGTKTTPLGNLGFNSDLPVSIIIGTWPAGLFGVSPTLGSNGCYVGQMDELRVYNKALTQLEVSGLYLNGKAGR